MAKKKATRKRKTKYRKQLETIAKKVGFTKEQIKAFPTDADLYMALSRVAARELAGVPAPQSKSDIRRISTPKEALPPPVPKEAKEVEFECTLHKDRAKNVRRSEYDEMRLVTFYADSRIATRDVKHVSIERSYVPDEKGVMTTKFKITYLV